MNKKDFDKIENIIYGIKPLFPIGYGMNRVSAIVWERIKIELKKKGDGK